MSIIILDAGHGGNDPGAGANGLLEKDLTLELVLRVQRQLICSKQLDVRLSRSSDTFVELAERAKFANQLEAFLFVSFHHNAGGGTGFESFVYPGTQDGKTGQIQSIVHSNIMNYLSSHDVKDRGTKEANFAVLRETKMSALLLENLFLDTVSDTNLLKDITFRNGLADSIANGIIKAVL